MPFFQEQDFDQIRQLMVRYYEGLYRCDVKKLQSVFHPSAQYHTIQAGQLLHYDMPTYYRVLEERTSPEKRGDSPFLQIDSISFAAPDTAVCQLRCRMLGKEYADILTLLKLDGDWRIMAKTFHATELDSQENSSCHM